LTSHVVLGSQARSIEHLPLVRELRPIADQPIELVLQILGTAVQIATLRDVLHDLPASALDVHRVRDERIETAADRKQARSRQLVEGAAMRDEARLRYGHSLRRARELLLVVFLLAIEVGQPSIELSQQENGVTRGRG